MRLENIVLRDFAAPRQYPTLSRHPLNLAAQLHFLLKQEIARPAILRALIGKVNVLKGLRSGFCECSHVDFLRYSWCSPSLQLAFLRLPKARHRPGRIGDDAERASTLYLDLILDDGRAERLGL